MHPEPVDVYLARLGVACDGKPPGSPEIAAYVAVRECASRYFQMASVILRDSAEHERRHYCGEPLPSDPITEEGA